MLCSGNGLVPSGNRPLPEAMLTQISIHILSMIHHSRDWSWQQQGPWLSIPSTEALLTLESFEPSNRQGDRCDDLCVSVYGPLHDEVIKFSALLAFVEGFHRSAVNSPHKGQWRGTLMFSLICIWTNGWVNNQDAGDLRRHRAHYDISVMSQAHICTPGSKS